MSFAEIKVSPELFVQALHLPDGTGIHECWFDPFNGGSLVLVVEHPTIPETEHADPRADVICSRDGDAVTCHYKMLPP